MSTPETTIVVAQERRRRSPLLLVAAVVTAALLAGGTFALWSASLGLDGGTITAGDLNLELSDDPMYYDVSADRTDGQENEVVDGVTGHEVDDTWLMVPGDTVAVVYEVEVTLTGDNMVAELSLDIDDDKLEIEGIDYTYKLYRENGDQLEASEGTDLVYLAPAESDDEVIAGEEGEDVPVYSLADETETFTVVIFATFDVDTPGRQDVLAVDALENIKITLTQVRTPGIGLFATAP
ncbi:MAG: SipW-dependent-type signal peptide-containing protein [Micrococcales bacterium]|nr:SipW-dependent-type signal peptide-containing protein [Micrococcales bacterium]MCL2667195.1 SipW-dependent-type signal peptide-containing protein [Micrococcales bacterium]